VHIIEEITANINLHKQDKVKLLEKVWFDVERWEFKDFDDKFIFDIKQQIQAMMNELILSDSVPVKDYYMEEYPFAEIEYTFEKGDKTYMIESMDPETESTLSEKYNIFDRIKFIYED